MHRKSTAIQRESAYQIGLVSVGWMEVSSDGFVVERPEWMPLSEWWLVKTERAAEVVTVFGTSLGRAIDTFKDSGLALARQAVA